MEDVGANGEIYDQILKEYSVYVWVGFIWSTISLVADTGEHGNLSSISVTGRDLFIS